VRRVVWSQDALDELDGIVAYISRDNHLAAGRVADRIARAVESLAFMPTGRPGRVIGTYEKIVPNLPYVIAYALMPATDEADVLAVLHVIHGARDWPEGAWPED
jgi:plasmid stabilization system protein ParE